MQSLPDQGKQCQGGCTHSDISSPLPWASPAFPWATVLQQCQPPSWSSSCPVPTSRLSCPDSCLQISSWLASLLGEALLDHSFPNADSFSFNECTPHLTSYISLLSPVESALHMGRGGVCLVHCCYPAPWTVLVQSRGSLVFIERINKPHSSNVGKNAGRLEQQMPVCLGPGWAVAATSIFTRLQIQKNG